MSYREFFPEEMIELQKEILKPEHTDIRERLKQDRVNDLGDFFGSLAAFFGILLDGEYDPVDLSKMLLKQLRQRGQLIVVDTDSRFIPVQVKESEGAVTIERLDPLKKAH